MSVSWDTARAERLWLEGQTAQQVADAVKAPSRSAVLGWMRRAGIEQGGRSKAPSPWTLEKADLAATLWLAGQTAPVIAAELGDGFTAKAVVNRMARDGIAKPLKVSLPRTTANRDAGPSGSFARGALADAQPPHAHLVARAEAAPVDPSRLKTLAERGRNECCWPVGAVDPIRGQLFCAAVTADRKSYCANHSPAQANPLKSVRWKEENTRAVRVERQDSDIDLVEVFA